jgi:hypothetical protein
MLEEAMTPYYEVCLQKLFVGGLGFRARQAIAEEFRYPFVDASGYFEWRQMGGEGPAPHQWCENYARRKVSSPYGVAAVGLR